jgi:Na+-driven multidrug efflux pump
MVATNMGAGQSDRALRAAWTGASVVALITGTIGTAAALAPALWMNHFTADPAVRAFGADYLQIVGASYSLFGLGLALFFASQGAGRMFWPLAGSVARVVVVAGGGWLAVRVFNVPATGFFFVIAAGFAVYAAMIGGAIWLGRWAQR